MTEQAQTGTLVISDGGLFGLIAMAIAAGAGGKAAGHAVWCVLPEAAYAGHAGALAGACERAASRQAEAFGFAFAGLAETGGAEAGANAGHRESMMLVRAAYAAAGAGCGRVLWPVVAARADGHGVAGVPAGPDLEAVSRAIDRATLVTRLVGIDLDGVGRGAGFGGGLGGGLGGRGVSEVRIETPFVDLSDVQLAGLAVDLGVPAELCWWWGGRRADLPGAEGEHARWAALLGRAGPMGSAGAVGRATGRPMTEVKPSRAAVAADDKGW